ncbi:MAG: hypothetical protein AAGC67_00500 [Myxococcota bacterium]
MIRRLRRAQPLRRGLVAVLFVTFLTQAGCWSFQTGPGAYAPQAPKGDGSAQAILRVNEAGVPWGNGELAEAIQKALIGRKAFSAVHYPVEPAPSADQIIVEVSGIGGLDEAILWGTIAAAATGWFFFLPAPILPYFQDYEGALEVTLSRDGNTIATFEVEAEAGIVHAIFATPEAYVDPARRQLIEHLALQVADGVVARL